MDIYRGLLWARQHIRTTNTLIFIIVFAVGLLVLAAIGAVLAQNKLRDQVATQLETYAADNQTILDTFAMLESEAGAQPCSDNFLHWLRRIAFLPDGIHEFMYAQGNEVLCSVTQGPLTNPISLNNPDGISATGNVAHWLDRDLADFGFPGITGTFMQHGNFVIIAPPPKASSDLLPWQKFEVVSRFNDGTLWHRDGTRGLYQRSNDSLTNDSAANSWQLREEGCDKYGMTCLAMVTPVAAFVNAQNSLLYVILAILALTTFGLTQRLNRYLVKTTAFPTRFRRRLSADSIACRYQPLVAVDDDHVVGVEVLARWKDVDGSIVTPDAFLPIVETYNLHLAFTRYVVQHAYAELSKLPKDTPPLLVHFNIFPQNFDADTMLDVFEVFLADSERFTVVIELIESDELPLDATRQTISTLNGHGILTYIDDFGVGYSSIQYLAGLGAHGVKLDRSFGQAPAGSMMDAMMTSAMEMVTKTGQALIVEGVETQTRMMALKANKLFCVVQGYYISKPLPIDGLIAFLSEQSNADAHQVA